MERNFIFNNELVEFNICYNFVVQFFDKGRKKEFLTSCFDFSLAIRQMKVFTTDATVVHRWGSFENARRRR